MHEVSLCGAIYEIAERAASGRQISVIHLQVGKLRQVVPDTLTFCWTVVSDDTRLAGSRLKVDYRPVILRCEQCGKETIVTGDLMMLCGSCGTTEVSIIGGEELLVTSVDLAEG